ncbi:MAG: type II toxin-antitoxin system RelE/ParE family toxin [Candidatus Saccharibacteria bacterium]
MSWTIQLYESPSGHTPVEDFIRSLQPATIAKLRHQLNLLAEFGLQLGMPNAKPIGNGMFELRVRGREEVRALYLFHTGKTIIVLHGFKKKTMAISRKDLNIARGRKAEVENLITYRL